MLAQVRHRWHDTNCCVTGAGLSVTLPDGTAVVRRVIDADNSCLFNAVGYVMQGSRSRAPALRSVLVLFKAQQSTRQDSQIDQPSGLLRIWRTNPGSDPTSC